MLASSRVRNTASRIDRLNNMTQSVMQSPIVVIGAGRSGSTLISRVLNAHTAIDFKGETGFLLLRLWMEVWQDRFWLNWPRHVATGPRCAADPLPPCNPDELAVERMRVGELVAELLFRLLRVEEKQHGRWGFKELWSGLPQYNHDWDAYDAVLPAAQWLHLIRHPFDFARSCADWNGTALTLDYLEARLSNWVSMLACNQLRSQTGRYDEIRLEDLMVRPEETLSPVLKAAGLSWESAMGKTLEKKTMSSCKTSHDDEVVLTTADAEVLIEKIPGLLAAMTSFDYSPPARTTLASEPRPERSVDLQGGERETHGRYLPRYCLKRSFTKCVQPCRNSPHWWSS